MRIETILVISSHIALALTVGGFLAPAALPRAQERKPLSPGDAVGAREFARLTRLALSPDGKRLAYSVTGKREASSSPSEERRSGAPFWASGTDIEIVDTETGATTHPASGTGNNWSPAWSPNGRYLAFFSDRDGTGGVGLWVWDRLEDSIKRLSELSIRGNQIEWTPDSREILFTTAPAGSSNRQSEKGREQTAQNAHASPGTADDGVTPTVTLYRADKSTASADKAPSSDPWGLDETLCDLHLAEVASGKSTVVLENKRVSTYLLSPDGSRVAYTSAQNFERPGSQQILFDLVVIFLASNPQQRVVASKVRLDYDGASFSWSPNSSRLSFQLGGMEESNYDGYVIDLDGGTLRKFSLPASTSNLHYRNPAPLWSEDAETLYLVHDGSLWKASIPSNESSELAEIPNRRILQVISKTTNILLTADSGKSALLLTHDDSQQQDGFYKVLLSNGQTSKLREEGQCYTSLTEQARFAVSEDGQKFVYVAEDDRHGMDLWLSSPALADSRRLTRLNPQFDERTFGSARLIHWLNDDGASLTGALLLPVGYQTDKHYPMVVWVYGGVSSSHQLRHFGLGYGGVFNFQLLATRGYAVLLPDMPTHPRTPMFDFAKDVLPGVDKVIEMGIADPDRIGVMGHSFGGYTTLSLVAQTKRFKAGIQISGFGDLVGYYGALGKDGSAFGTSVLEGGLPSMGGTPWEFREAYLENSPVYKLDRVDTPLLIVHGNEDVTVPVFLADQIFVGMRRLGKTVAYAKYEGEGHILSAWSYANQLDFCNRMMAWFEEYLKPDQTN